MQRVLGLTVAAGILLGSPLHAQDAAGAALWRLAATTLAVPPALATGPAASFWNPAQRDDSATRAQIALEAIQTPSSINASALLAAARWRLRAAGEVGLIYGRVGLSDLARTTDSPDATGGEVPVYTFALGATWGHRVLVAGLRTTIGGTLAFHETRLDTDRSTRWTADVGFSTELGSRLRVAAASHFFSPFSSAASTQDIYAGLEYRIWQGPLWGDRTALRGRYGIAFGHGFDVDHHWGLGAEFGAVLAVDGALVREGGYSTSSWRPIGGLRLRIGRYRISVARDAGVQDLGSAYRVGLDARFP